MKFFQNILSLVPHPAPTHPPWWGTAKSINCQEEEGASTGGDRTRFGNVQIWTSAKKLAQTVWNIQLLIFFWKSVFLRLIKAWTFQGLKLSPTLQHIKGNYKTHISHLLSFQFWSCLVWILELNQIFKFESLALGLFWQMYRCHTDALPVQMVLFAFTQFNIFSN